MSAQQHSKQATVRGVPLAIIGMGCLFPKAASVGQYWTNIREGVDAITDIPATHWDPAEYFAADPAVPDMTYARRGGFLDPVDFDPLRYGLSPTNIEATDTTQLLGMVVAREALLDAGYATSRENHDGRPFDRDRTSVILGVTGTLELVIPLGARLGHPLWRRALAEAGVDPATAEEVVQRISEQYVPWQENSFPGLLGNVAAGRIANRFDLGGTNCVVDAACASSLSAVHMAAMELYTNRADMAITGGLDTFNDIFMYMCFSKTPALSPTGDAKPFDSEGDGTILGEGLGVVVLKRLADAQRDGDKVYAVLKGIGAASDGRGHAIYAPSADGQRKALRRAYAEAAVSPRSIELVEAHGTGTKVGDAVEIEALSSVYRQAEAQGPHPMDAGGSWCAIGSVKSMIGHTKSAAGIAGMIKLIKALQHHVLPPTLKVRQPLAQLQPGSAPVYVNARKRPWVNKTGQPRRAALSAFGFGGSNFHCVLEEAPESKPEIEWDGEVLLLALSGESINSLQQQLADIDATVAWPVLRAVAARSLLRFDAQQPCRLAMVMERTAEYQQTLAAAAEILARPPDEPAWHRPDGICFSHTGEHGKLALLFPGQGAQYVNMLLDLACQSPQLRQALELANAVCRECDVTDYLSDVIYPPSVFTEQAAQQQAEQLRTTRYAQPAIGAISIGALDVLQRFAVPFHATAGHSFGELSALYAAGRISRQDLFRLANKRGQLMQANVGEQDDQGAMLAASASAAVLHEMLEAEPLDLIIANHNAPAQVVLSGATAAIAEAEALLTRRGIRSSRLPVAAAFHSSYVAAAERPFAAYLQDVEFGKADMPVFANATARPYPADADAARQLLASQLARPVEFVSQIENMYADGIDTFVEVGPGNTLTSLVKAILTDKPHQAIALDASRGRRHGQYDLACLLARLSVAGFSLDLTPWDAGYLDRCVNEKKPAMTVTVSGANHVNPRPRRDPVTPPPQPPQAPPARPVSDHGTRTGMQADASPHLPMTAQPDHVPPDSALPIAQQSILALQKMQEQTAALHQQYLQGQAAAQQSIQQLITQQQQQLGIQPDTPPVVELAPPIVDTPPVATDRSAAPEMRPAPDTADRSANDAPGNIPDAVRDAATHGQAFFARLLLEVVAEKTGYPVDMLSLEMSLDTDLGIDSIKRVEILSALQERLPAMSKIQPEQLGTFQVLAHIVEYLATDDDLAAPPPAPASTPPPVEAAVADMTWQATMLEVVAEKTGYPPEMLDVDMHLDTDLGIDSIKRVEILSALQERLPAAPAVAPEDLASLQTLRQIIDYMQAAGPATAADARVDAALTEPSPEPSPGPSSELSAGQSVGQSLYRCPVTLVELDDKAGQPLILAADAPLCITDDGSRLPRQLAAQCHAAGINATIIAIDEHPAMPTGGLIILTPPAADAAFIEAGFALMQAVNSEHLQLLVGITRQGGRFALTGSLSASAHSAGISGLIKTADKEWPHVHCKVLDLPADVGETLRERLLPELLTAGPLEVGLTEQHRYAIALRSEAVSASASRLPVFAPGDVVVVSGGARGVTAEVAIALAEQFKVNLLLLGRSELPAKEPDWLQDVNDAAAVRQAIILRQTDASPAIAEKTCQAILAAREIRHNLERMREGGVTVSYQAVDVRHGEAVAACIDKARAELGPISGVIHAAGVLADKLIEDKTAEQFQDVFSTKVAGAEALLRATANDALKAIVMFSSSSARFGRRGQADYAAANEVLNKLAQQQRRQRPSCRVLSLNWGPWDGGMVTPALKQLFASEGVEVIGLRAGAAYLLDELGSKADEVEIVISGSAPAPAYLSEQEQAPAATEAGGLRLAFERLLTVKDYPVLAHHVINGRAVLPAALIAEWLIHGAIHANPGLRFAGLDDLQILKGVTLTGAEQRPLQIMAGTEQGIGDVRYVPVELCSGNRRHARASIILGSQPATNTDHRLGAITGDYALSWPAYYANGQLFHGPLLQSVTEVLACSDTGIQGCAASAPPPSAWMAQPIRSSWYADPALLDAAFQLMILWSFAHSGRGCLPTRIGRYRQFQQRLPRAGVSIISEIVSASEGTARANIEFLDEGQQVIARLDEYECVIDESLNAAFARNTLDKQASLSS